MRIGPSIHRVGREGLVNAYLVEERGEITLVDAGMPGQYGELERELRVMGRSLRDIRAVVLTHGHTDHIGFAERLRRELSVPVSIHEADAALARGAAPNPARGLGPWRVSPLLRFVWYALRQRGLRPPKLLQVATFGDGATLDVPGSPRVVLVPGHTPGSAALHLPSLDALFVGDALATYAVTNGRKGPQLAPFTADRAQALASLARIEGMAASLVLPGHGEPWLGSPADAVAAVRANSA